MRCLWCWGVLVVQVLLGALLAVKLSLSHLFFFLRSHVKTTSAWCVIPVFGVERVLPGVHKSRARPLHKDRAHGRATRGTLCLGAAGVRQLRRCPLLLADIAAPDEDSKLVEYLESLMILGHHSSKGMKLLAAVLHVCPWIRKQSRTGLPQACRGLGGWKKKCPSRSRVPPLFVVFAAIVNQMVTPVATIWHHGLEEQCSAQPVVAAANTVPFETQGPASDH